MKKILVITMLFVFASICLRAEAERPFFCVADRPAPVLNTPEFSSVFGKDGAGELKVDPSGLIREVEFVALTGTVFKVEKKVISGGRLYYKVLTEDYPYPSSKGYFVDARFVSPYRKKLSPRRKIMPSKEVIFKRLRSAVGNIYIWGGNVSSGVPEMLKYYPPGHSLSKLDRKKWSLAGVDCSGLLYQATGGATPRNTNSLIKYGRSVKIQGASVDEILDIIQPLDIIVWKGHVIIVLDENHCIESRLDYDKSSSLQDGGVRIRSSGKVIRDLVKERAPVNEYPSAGGKYFVIRRWFSKYLHI